MKIIDFEKHGNVVRFYIGEDSCTDYRGDDWNDYPYDGNAGEVYDEFIIGYKDIAFPFDWAVLEPADGYDDCGFCKSDMKDRLVPCIIAVPSDILEISRYTDTFSKWIGADNIYKFYFGDEMEASNSLVIFGEQ